MERLYIAMERELLVINHRAGQWQVDTHMVGFPTQCLAADPFHPEQIYCGTFAKGLWCSEDAGASWKRIGEGVSSANVTAVAVSHTERTGEYGVVWAGTEPSALYRSEDRGRTFQELAGLRELPSRSTWSFPPRPWTHHVRWITPDVVVDGRVFVCIERGGVMRSLDGGQTWEDRKPDGPLDAHTLRTHRLAEGHVYTANGDGFASPGMGYSERFDGGDTWQYFSDGLKHHYLYSLAVDPGNPETVIVSASPGPAEAHNSAVADSTIYRRTGRQSWLEIRDGLPETKGTIIPLLETNESEPGVFYAVTNKGVFRSADAGLTWKRLDISWPDQFQHQHPQALVVTR